MLSQTHLLKKSAGYALAVSNAGKRKQNVSVQIKTTTTTKTIITPFHISNADYKFLVK